MRETDLDPFEADFLADLLHHSITEHRELAACEHAAGRINAAELKWHQAHSKFIEGIAKKLFPSWGQ